MTRVAERLRHSVRGLRHDQSGVIAAITAFVLLPAALAVGVGIDASRAYLVESRLSQAVDAAALAGAQVAGTDLQAVDIQSYFDANFPKDYMSAKLEPLKVTYNEDTDRMEVVAEATVPTTLMRLAHIMTISVSARAVVIRKLRGMELALVLDVTGSMAGSKLQASKDAANILLDILYGGSDTGEDLYTAVVPFSARVNIGTGHRSWLTPRNYTGTWGGCVELRSGAYELDDTPPDLKTPDTDLFKPTNLVTVTGWHTVKNKSVYGAYTPAIPCPVALLPLTASRATVTKKINGMAATGTTRLDFGMEWGWRVLSERWRGLWGDPILPLDKAAEPDKVIVFMTDGENVTDVYDFDSAGKQLSVTGADTRFKTLCQKAKNDGIIVYTVTFQAPAAVEPMMTACASSTSRHFVSPTESQLRTIFRLIAGQLSELRLSE